MNIHDIATTDQPQGNAFYKETLDKVVDSFLTAIPSRKIMALLLKGAPARGDATVVQLDASFFSLSDIDFIAVVNEEPTPELLKTVREWEQTINHRFKERISGIDVSVMPRQRLGELPHTIATYETALSPAVIWGDTEVETLLPRFPINEIPMIDCLTYFHNRVLEQFLMYRMLRHFPDNPRRHYLLLYKTGKLILDLATAFLYTERNAPPSYAGRVKTFTRIISSPTYRFFATIRDSFLDRLNLWLDFKHRGDLEPVFHFYNLPNSDESIKELVSSLWYESIDWIFPFWKHIFQRMGFDVKTSTSWQEISRLYTSIESLPRKGARWLKILRHPNVEARWFPLSRIARSGTRAGPRLLIYRTAVLSYLSCSPDFASPEIEKTIISSFPMRGAGTSREIDEEHRLEYIAESLYLFYCAVILNRLPDKKEISLE